MFIKLEVYHSSIISHYTWIKEAIWIRKTKPTMNRDEGGYRLSHVWDSLLATQSSEQ